MNGRRVSMFVAGLVAVLATASGSQGRRTPAGLTAQRWNVDGIERTGLVSEPTAPLPAAGAPLVLVFHGHGGTAANMARSFAMHSEWPGAVVLYLQGLPAPGAIVDPAGRRAGWQSAPGKLGDRDLKFVDAALVWAKANYKVDSRRIYATGHSNGGWFTYVLWAARGDQFAAFAPAAAVFGQMVTAARPKPAMIIAGEKDALVPFAAQRRTITAVLQLDRADTAGMPWNGGARLHSSAIGADVVTYVHPGAHPMPRDAASLVAKFFKAH